MIESILIFNKHGNIRFYKIYSEDESKINKINLIEDVFKRINGIKNTNIIFDYNFFGTIRNLIFRQYGNVFIAMIVDESENELATLDFINVIMAVLDDVFKGLSEYNLIMYPDKVYYVMDEMVSGGTVIETNKNEIMNNFNEKMKN